MRTIIHLSDFHLRIHEKRPEDNDVFVGMIKAIKSQELGDAPIIVYNGDFILFNDIKAAVDADTSRRKKETKWYRAMEKAFLRAEEYFVYLVKELGVLKENIIICCGNHDVFNEKTLNKDIDCPKKKPEAKYGENRFKLFSALCERITGRPNSEQVQFYPIQGFNFLIVNSNWIEKYEKKGKNPLPRKLCIDCNDLFKIIDDHRSEIAFQEEPKKKINNIFISHAPLGDFCEDGRYTYPDRKTPAAAIPEVNRYFSIKLLGDKHTNDENNYEYIVGAPLTWPEISLNIYQFDSEDFIHRKTIQYSKKKWKVFGSEKDINTVLSYSKAYIKGRAKKYMFGDENVVDYAKKIQNFESERIDKNWRYLDLLLRASVNIKEPVKGDKPKTIIPPVDGSLIDTLTDLIIQSNSIVSIRVKGLPRLGKSVCLSLLYMNMLYRYSCGLSPFVPLYFDVEKAVSNTETRGFVTQNRDSAEVRQKIKTSFEKFLSDGIEYAKRVGHKACCIIDGLNEYYLYSENRIEDSIEELLDEYNGDPDSIIGRKVYCIDSNNDTRLGKAPQDKIEAQYLVYFNIILTNVIGDNLKLDDFIHAFSELHLGSPADEKTVKANLNKMGITQVDTNLLINFWDDLKVDSGKSYYTLISEFIHRSLTMQQRKIAAAACYSYTVDSKTYKDSFSSQDGKMQNKEFDFIRTQRMVINYLLAANYVDNIDHFSAYNLKCIDRLYGHDVCFFIREDIKTRHMDKKLLDFANTHTDKLSNKGLSTLAYLIGRADLDRTEKNEWFIAAKEYIERNKEKEPDKDKKVFLAAVAQRSIRLSEIKASTNTISEYIHLLIGDDFERNINRSFYLQFYGDRMEADGSSTKRYPAGLDVFNTYQVLASRLEKLKQPEEWNEIHRLELFTLCDMIQMRIDIPDFTIPRDGGEPFRVRSYFYHEAYNPPNDDLGYKTIKKVNEIISNYLHWFEKSNDVLFIGYLEMCQKVFESAEKKLMFGVLDSKEFAFNANHVMKQIMPLSKVRRVGWHLSKTPTEKLTKKEIESLRNEGETIETTLEHTYEAFAIGLLYLPDVSLKNDNYNKQTILNMLLIHDIGEATVGDILFSFENYKELRKEEDSFCKTLFLQSVHNDISNLNTFFDLWDRWNNHKDDYNAKVAKDIDIIQRIFKLLQLLDSHVIVLSPERVNDFLNDRSRIITSEGKRIFNILVSEDPHFEEVLKETLGEYNQELAKFTEI